MKKIVYLMGDKKQNSYYYDSDTKEVYYLDAENNLELRNVNKATYGVLFIFFIFFIILRNINIVQISGIQFFILFIIFQFIGVIGGILFLQYTRLMLLKNSKMVKVPNLIFDENFYPEKLKIENPIQYAFKLVRVIRFCEVFLIILIPLLLILNYQYVALYAIMFFPSMVIYLGYTFVHPRYKMKTLKKLK